jgi:hypothetical protein
MTDRELLELAAKAAGIEGSYFDSDNPIHRGIYQARGEYYWNPLISDSEAFRLAVKLEFDLTRYAGHAVEATGRSPTHGTPATYITCRQELEADPYAATRRAIVRAAAAIGDRL